MSVVAVTDYTHGIYADDQHANRIIAVGDDIIAVKGANEIVIFHNEFADTAPKMDWA